MTATLNASTTSGVVITSDNSGNLALQANGNTVVTIIGSGANAGIQMGSAFTPAFSAYANATQSIGNNAWVKVQYQAELYDTANAFDNATNYRFQPTVAGYYQASGGIAFASAISRITLALYKNGSIAFTLVNANSSMYSVYGSCLVYLNGSTDYIEMYVNQVAGSSQNSYAGTSSDTYFQACYVRSA